MGPDIRASNAYHLQPLTRAHLYSNSDYGIETQADIRHDSRNEGPGIQGDIRQVYLFAFIGVALLAIACINFMNLTTARSANRAREVGMRKVVGAHRTQLVHQFLGESILLTFLALLLALALASGAMPILNAFLNRELNLDLFTDRTLLPGLLSLSLIVGFLSGGYPAFLLSAFQPTQVLKGTPNAGGTWFRKGLVVVQFAVSILLIVSTTMVHRQLTYMREKKWALTKNTW
jgi:putative ABC transport system permease protein